MYRRKHSIYGAQYYLQFQAFPGGLGMYLRQIRLDYNISFEEMLPVIRLHSAKMERKLKWK